MATLYIVNATRQRHRIPLVLDSGRVTRFDVPSLGQEQMAGEFSEADKMRMVQHIERYGGLDISETHKTPPGFSGLAYRWDRPAKVAEIEGAHEVEMVRREKVSAREMTNAVKAFDGRARNIRGIQRPESMITETVIEETVPTGETPPSGGLMSKIIGDVSGDRLDIGA
ncbi:MAG: hypothetical protein ACYC3L_00895 [Gemmatimonadaceae bacterium]